MDRILLWLLKFKKIQIVGYESLCTKIFHDGKQRRHGITSGITQDAETHQARGQATRTNFGAPAMFVVCRSTVLCILVIPKISCFFFT